MNDPLKADIDMSKLIKPPTGGSGVYKPCEHKYVHLNTRQRTECGTISKIYVTEKFFCEKCLDIREITTIQSIVWWNHVFKGKER